MSTLRPLEKGDLPALKRLHRFAKFEGSPVFGEDQTGVAELLTSACNNLDGVTGSCCVDSDGVFGAITLQDELFTDQARQVDRPLVILTVVVRADMRASGFASLLVSTAEQQASLNGNTSLVTDVSSSNRPAISFFLRQGFQERKDGGLTTELYRDLAPGHQHDSASSRSASTTTTALLDHHHRLRTNSPACSGNKNRLQVAPRPFSRACFRSVKPTSVLKVR